MVYPLCFVESEFYPVLNFQNLAAHFANHPEICQVNEKHIQFKITGFLFIENRPIIVFPKNYSIPGCDTLLREHAKTLARTLLHYRNESGLDYKELSLLYGNLNIKSGQIASAIQILDDYRQYGYINRETIEKSYHQRGTIDWGATISTTLPLFSQGSAEYLLPVYRHKILDENNLISIIHKNIVNECINSWGWLYGGTASIKPHTDCPCSGSECIRVLEKELTTVFVRREIHLIKLMLEFIKSKTGSENILKLNVLATPYFNFVWEAICGYLFSNQYSRLKSILPQPEWESDFICGNISQRPDIFTLDEKNLYILDAKYYNFNNNLPGWHDTVKQLFYRHTILKNLSSRTVQRLLPNIRSVFNAFILPGTDNRSLQYIGRVFIRDIDDLGDIKAFAINQYKAMHTYAFRDDDNYRVNLLHAIVAEFK